MTWWEAVVLGIVEGITEYLPISSTGHLILVSALLGLDEPEARKQAVDAFLILIQGGAILAVLGLYRKRVASMLRGVAGRDRAGRRLLRNLIIAFLPAAVLGPLVAETVERLLFRAGPVIAALAVGGLVMLLLRRWQARFFRDEHDEAGEPIGTHSFVDLEHLTWRRALLIGCLQCVAMWPGTSRSMTTIVGGMLSGLRPRDAAEFSFLLGVPTLGGACVYRALRSSLSDRQSVIEVLGPAPLIIGIVVATLSAAVAIRWLVSYLSRHGLALFGWYRIGLCLVMMILVMRGLVSFDG